MCLFPEIHYAEEKSDIFTMFCLGILLPTNSWIIVLHAVESEGSSFVVVKAHTFLFSK